VLYKYDGGICKYMIKNNTGIQASSTVKPMTHNKAVNTKKSPTIKNTDGHVKIIDAKE